MTSVDNRAEKRRQAREEAKSRPNRFLQSWLWLKANAGVITVLLASGAILVEVGRLHGRFTTVEEAINGTSNKPGLEAQIGKVRDELRQKVASLEGEMKYVRGLLDGTLKKTALSKGFKDPTIQAVKLNQQEIQPVSYRAEGRTPYNITLRIQRITKDKIEYRLDGKIGGNTFENTLLVQSFKVGVPINLTRPIYVTGMPNIYFAVLDVPSENTAIVVLGPRQTA
jgi:hypothetical protein